MITATCFGLLVLAAVLLLAVQDSYWRKRLAIEENAHDATKTKWAGIHQRRLRIHIAEKKILASQNYALATKVERLQNDLGWARLTSAVMSVDRDFRPSLLGDQMAKVLPIRGGR